MSTPDPERVDVQALMREVQRRARRVEAANPTAEHDAGTMATMRASYDLLSVPVESPRRGVGAVIGGVRRAVARLLTGVFHRQTTFNGAVVRMLGETQARLLSLETDMTRLDGLVGNVEQHVAALEQQSHERLQHLGARLARLATAGPGPRGPVPPAGQEAVDQFSMQERFRGSEAEIKARQRVYVEHFVGAAPALDVGCGRGEFLELLREAGVRARGVDLDRENVLLCHAKGLDVVLDDAFAYLEQQPDESLGGIFCAQFVEHFPPPRLLYLTSLWARKLRPGGVLLIETPNPQTVAIFARAFYLDFTHVWPYHPEAMKFVVEAAGFGDVQFRFSSPLDPEARLPELREASVFGSDTAAYNRAAVLVNELLFGPQDYAVIGRKAGPAA